MQQKLYKTGRLQSRFEKKGAQASSAYRVLPTLYQACLRYTLTAKIAPLWNKAGEWLLQGRDFITHNGYINGIKMNLLVNSNEVYMSVYGTSVKIAHLQLDDLNVDTECLKKMLQGDPRFQILELDQWVYVLPSMKKGRIISVSRQISQYDCPFKTYRDLKKHWKNTYGYRIPEAEDDLLFYQVTFRPLGGQLFTYPSICLRNRNLQRMPRIDPKPVITRFLQDVQCKITSLCGQPFKFQPKIRYLQPELHNGANVRSETKTNLSSRNPNPASVPLRHVNTLQHMYSSHPYKQMPQSPNNPVTQPLKSIHNTPEVIIAGTKTISSSTSSVEKDQRILSSSMKNKTINNHQNNVSLGMSSSSNNQNSAVYGDKKPTEQNKQQLSRIIPLFRPKSMTIRHVYKPEVPKSVPSFCAKMKSQTFSSSQKTPQSSAHNVKVPTSINNAQPRALPIFSSKKLKPTFTAKNIVTNSYQAAPKVLPSFIKKMPTPLLTPNSAGENPLTTKKAAFGSAKQIQKTPKPREKSLNTPKRSPVLSTSGNIANLQNASNVLSTSKPKQSTTRDLSFTSFGSNPKALSTPKPKGIMSTSNFKQKENMFTVTDEFDTSFDVYNNFLPSPAIACTPTKPLINCGKSPNLYLTDSMLMKTPDGKAKKRKDIKTPSIQDENGEPKKPRAKPKLQDVDVEQLARSNQLGNVNALTLTTWLKQRCIVCKSKDKKGDLVDKVFSFLHLTKPIELQSIQIELHGSEP